MANTIADMLAMETAEPDKTLTPIDVFGEKSQDADNLKGKVLDQLSSFLFGPENIDMGYAPDLALSPLFSKNAPSIIKQLLRGGSKAKDPFWINPKMLKKYPEGMMRATDSPKYLSNVRSSNVIDDIVAWNKESKAAIEAQKALGRHRGVYSDPSYTTYKGGTTDPKASSFDITDEIELRQGELSSSIIEQLLKWSKN